MLVANSAIVKDAPGTFAILIEGFTIDSVPSYPPRIHEKFSSPGHLGKAEGANAVGTAATFVCGSFVAVSVRIDGEQKKVSSVRFQTNGCGYMIAAAETLAETIEDRLLSELHGLNDENLLHLIGDQLGKFEPDRVHCQRACLEAVHAAFSNYRSSQLEEFQGEKALICTCFGVSEETIEREIVENSASSVEIVGEICNAGTGCGSCRMLIQEMIDQHGRSGNSNV